MRMSGILLLTCLGSWALIAWLVFPSNSAEIFLGMLAPLLLVLSTTWLVERTLAESPDRLTSLMAAAFLMKMLACGVYVALVIGLFGFQAVPFAVSFTAYFAGLYLVEALHLRTILQAK